MCAKLLKKSKIKRILVVSLTNIGDVVMTCPVIDILRKDFPQAQIDVVVGPKAVSLFEGNRDLRVNVYEKKSTLKQKFEWFSNLSMAKYDCVVDLRRTILSLFLRPKYTTPVFLGKSFTGHKRDAHLHRLSQVYEFDALAEKQQAVLTTAEDEQFFEAAILPAVHGQDFVVIAPGAADSAKRWHVRGFAAVADHLALQGKVVFVGDARDAEIIEEIQARMKNPALSLAGKINLRQLAFILKKCSWALTHDSGVMHLASYFNVPLVVLWGPTDLGKYAPWSQKSVIVRRNEKCARCLDPQSDQAHNCMSFIEVDDVINSIAKISNEKS